MGRKIGKGAIKMSVKFPYTVYGKKGFELPLTIESIEDWIKEYTAPGVDIEYDTLKVILYEDVLKILLTNPAHSKELIEASLKLEPFGTHFED